MAPILYMLPASPPVRAVLMTAKCLNIELEKRECNVIAGDQHKEDYLKVCINSIIMYQYIAWRN